MSQGVYKGVYNEGGESRKLSKNQKEILDLITKEFLTEKQILLRRNISRQALNKTIRKLKIKGLIFGTSRGGFTKREGVQGGGHHEIRLHNQQFKLKILWKSNLYHKLMTKNNILKIDGNTVQLFSKVLIVSCSDSRFFFGPDPEQALNKSMEYWLDFFRGLEVQFNIKLVSPQNTHINQFNAHFSEIQNELAKNLNDDRKRLIIKSNDDGKLWFIIDNSLNLNEAETLHPQTAFSDMQEKIQPFFNDLRDREWIKLSELSQQVSNMAYLTNEIAHGLKIVVDLIKSQIPKEEPENKEKPDYFG